MMNMTHLPLLSIFRTRKTSDGPLLCGKDWRWFAILDIEESHDASDAPHTPSRAN
jgi:hypothetical protein